MSSSPSSANQLLLNKFCWMARQLRNFNDSSSIMQWSTAMMSVKNLLLNHQEIYSNLPSYPPKETYSNPHHVWTVSHPTTLSFPPTRKRIRALSRSSTPSLNFAPTQLLSPSLKYSLTFQPSAPNTKASATTTTRTLPDKLCNINYTNPHSPLQPPCVDLDDPPLKKAKAHKPLVSGIFFWHRFSPTDDTKEYWALHNFDGADPYEIIQKLHGDSMYSVQKRTTGQLFKIRLLEKDRLK